MATKVKNNVMLDTENDKVITGANVDEVQDFQKISDKNGMKKKFSAAMHTIKDSEAFFKNVAETFAWLAERGIAPWQTENKMLEPITAFKISHTVPLSKPIPILDDNGQQKVNDKGEPVFRHFDFKRNPDSSVKYEYDHYSGLEGLILTNLANKLKTNDNRFITSDMIDHQNYVMTQVVKQPDYERMSIKVGSKAVKIPDIKRAVQEGTKEVSHSKTFFNASQINNIRDHYDYSPIKALSKREDDQKLATDKVMEKIPDDISYIEDPILYAEAAMSRLFLSQKSGIPVDAPEKDKEETKAMGKAFAEIIRENPQVLLDTANKAQSNASRDWSAARGAVINRYIAEKTQKTPEEIAEFRKVAQERIAEIKVINPSDTPAEKHFKAEFLDALAGQNLKLESAKSQNYASSVAAASLVFNGVSKSKAMEIIQKLSPQAAFEPDKNLYAMNIMRMAEKSFPECFVNKSKSQEQEQAVTR